MKVRTALEKLNWNPDTLKPRAPASGTNSTEASTSTTKPAEKPKSAAAEAPKAEEVPKLSPGESNAPKVSGRGKLPSGLKVASVAGDALLLGQMATADTPEATHAVLVDAVFFPVELSMKYSPQALILKHGFGVDLMHLTIPFPTLPWSERAKFEEAARRHGTTLAP